MVSIYVLINPENEQVLYVGATQKPNNRYKNHCSSYKPLIPEMLIVDEVDLCNAEFYEGFYLDLFRSWGFHLPQITPSYKKPLANEDVKPHPIDLKELKKPLMQIGSKLDRSIPYLVRIAVREWINRNYPENNTQ